MTPAMDKTVEVSQAARDAAADLVGSTEWSRHQFLNGNRDKHKAVQAFARFEATTRATQPEAALREALPKTIGRLELGEHLSSEHYCGGSHDMPDGQPVYWQERGGEHPDDIDGYCLSCAIEQAESDAGWCECSIQAALKDHQHG